MTEDEMVGWHQRPNGYALEQTLRDGEGQGSLVCCNPWGGKESDTAERLNKSGNFRNTASKAPSTYQALNKYAIPPPSLRDPQRGASHGVFFFFFFVRDSCGTMLFTGVPPAPSTGLAQ